MTNWTKRNKRDKVRQRDSLLEWHFRSRRRRCCLSSLIADRRVPSKRGLNGVNRQPSKKVDFTVNRQASKMQIDINRYNFQGISSLTMLADLLGLLAPKEALNSKNHVSKLPSLDLDSTKPYNLLVSGNISIFFFKWKGRKISKS